MLQCCKFAYAFRLCQVFFLSAGQSAVSIPWQDGKFQRNECTELENYERRYSKVSRVDWRFARRISIPRLAKCKLRQQSALLTTNNNRFDISAICKYAFI